MRHYQTVLLQDAATATGDGEALEVGNARAVNIHFVDVGTPSATLTFESTLDGTNWIAQPMIIAAGTYATTLAAPGLVRLPLDASIKMLRARISTYGSGQITVVAGRS